MITPDRSIAKWQRELQQAYRCPQALLAALRLEAAQVDLPAEPPGGFGLRVPQAFVDRMRPGDPQDPLLRQVLPSADELAAAPGFDRDPVGEHHLLQGDGLIRKYRGRALVITTAACAVHCRYCFRREFPYADEQADAGRWARALARIADDTSIDEVILSGGDPLSLSDRRLAAMLADLRGLPHLRRVRLHTRQPVVLPSRVDDGLLAALAEAGKPPVVVIHANHPREIDGPVADALAALRGAGATLLNQTVLLRGINDDPEVLGELSQRLHDSGVMPYYLHLLDRVTGAAHFEVSEDRARAIARDLHAQLPGYLVPRLVREETGKPGKTWLAFT